MGRGGRMASKGGNSDMKRKRRVEGHWGLGRSIAMGDLGEAKMGASCGGSLLLSGQKRVMD